MVFLGNRLSLNSKLEQEERDKGDKEEIDEPLF